MIRTMNDLILFYFSKHFIFSVHDPIRDLIRDPIWSDPGFVDAEKEWYYGKPRYICFTFIKTEVECKLV